MQWCNRNALICHINNIDKREEEEEEEEVIYINVVPSYSLSPFLKCTSDDDQMRGYDLWLAKHTLWCTCAWWKLFPPLLRGVKLLKFFSVVRNTM